MVSALLTGLGSDTIKACLILRSTPITDMTLSFGVGLPIVKMPLQRHMLQVFHASIYL